MARNKLSKALAEIEARLDRDQLLTGEEKEQVRAKAREEVAKRRKDTALKDYLETAIKEEEASYIPAQQLENVLINLPDHAPFISLDGIRYFHGLIYGVTYGAARVMDDVMARAWEHQNEIDGHPRRGDLTRRPRNSILRPGMEGTSAGRLNTVNSMTRI